MLRRRHHAQDEITGKTKRRKKENAYVGQCGNPRRSVYLHIKDMIAHKLSIYIHIPFCEKRCHYCDFVSCCELDKIDAYIEVLCEEINNFKNAQGYAVATIYIGGGTPSILSARQITKIVNTLRSRFIIDDDAEISIECNPNSLLDEKCCVYRILGINRISIGVQSFNDDELKVLGRLHTAEQAVSAIKLAGRYFNNISIDLINNGELKIDGVGVLPLIKHISVYSLIINENCKLPEPDEEKSISCQKQIEKILTKNGFRKYEVSNYAKKGFGCRHNNVYWNGGEYAGFGAAAHSLIDNIRFANSIDIDEYIAGRGFRVTEHGRTEAEIRAEQIMLGLRTRGGISLSLAASKPAEIAFLTEQDLIKIKKNKIIATERGLLLLNQIILKLV
jgi:oxygen-independent coproporphyrinogen-3 oxidase